MNFLFVVDYFKIHVSCKYHLLFGLYKWCKFSNKFSYEYYSLVKEYFLGNVKSRKQMTIDNLFQGKSITKSQGMPLIIPLEEKNASKKNS